MKGIIDKCVMWRIAILWVILFSVNSLATSMMCALAGSDWASLRTQDKFVIVLGIIANWTGMLLAFLNKAATKINEGKLPFDGNTTIIERQDKSGQTGP